MKYCILIITLILFSCQTSNEQANRETSEIEQNETLTDENQSEENPSQSTTEDTFDTGLLNGHWLAADQGIVGDHWLEFDISTTNFFSWTDDQLMKSLPAGSYKLDKDKLVLDYDEFSKEVYRIDSLTEKHLILIPLSFSDTLIYVKSTYKPKFDYNILNREYYLLSDSFNINLFYKNPSFRFKFKDDRLTSWECDKSQSLENCTERNLNFVKIALSNPVFSGEGIRLTFNADTLFVLNEGQERTYLYVREEE